MDCWANFLARQPIIHKDRFLELRGLRLVNLQQQIVQKLAGSINL
jgi:hypothetical protein